MRDSPRINYWVPIAIIIVLVSLIMVYTESQSNIGVYVGGDTTTTAVTEDPNAVALIPQVNEAKRYQVGIPEGWTYVNQEGNDTYVHAPSKTSAQVIIQEFDPILLQMNAEKKQEILGEGYTVEDFEWISNSCYTCIYQSSAEAGGYIFVEIMRFDRNTSANLICSLMEVNYEYVIDSVLAIIKSFDWIPQNAYPSDVYLVYSPYGNYEFAYPAGWNTGVQNGVYLAQDPNTGTMMSVMAVESAATYAGMNKLNYYNWVAGTRTNFAIQSFESSASSVYAVSTYSAGGTSMVLIHYLVATGKFEYTLTFEIPYSVYNSQVNFISQLINLFRIHS